MSQPQETLDKINQFSVGKPLGFVPPPINDFNDMTPEWYMNHNCHGNIGFDKDGNFIAIRAIMKGEELTYDYGLVKSRPTFLLNCNCGETDCRKIITGNDWRDPIFKKEHLTIMHPPLRGSANAAQ